MKKKYLKTVEDLLAYKKAYNEIAKIVTDEYARYHEEHYKEEDSYDDTEVT